MGKTSVVLLATILAFASVAFSAQKIEDIPWDESHIKQLRAAGKAAVLRFVQKTDDSDFSLSDYGEFEFDWYPAGDGKYELAVSSSTGPDISYLDIYWRDAPGKIRSQEFIYAAAASDQWYWNEGGTDIVDANGDGVPEVIDLDDLDYHPPPQRTKFIPGGMWPRIYRLRDEQYVEASRDFSAFYDKTIFPMINASMANAHKRITELAEQKAKPGTNDSQNDDYRQIATRTLAGVTMCRDKILRVLGRDPNAGLAQAREWMTSPDPVMVDNARVVFQDIGGHDEEVRAAKLATERASKNWPNKYW
jgi:hypothetical protein